MRNLELSLAVADARLSYGNSAGAHPMSVALDTLDLALRRGQRLHGSARGMLLGEPVKLSLRGGTLAEMLRDLATPIKLEIAAARAKLRIEGTLAPSEETRETSTHETALSFAFQARRTGDLARWLGVAPESKLPLALGGRVRIASDAWFLEQTRLKLGRSELTLDARRSRVGDRQAIVASVRSSLIDAPELATLRASTGRSNDAAVFPDAIDLADFELDLALQHVLLGRTDLVDVGFVANIREGRLQPSTLTGKVAGVPFAGLVALDLRSEPPEARLDLSTGEIDVGALLRDMSVAEDIDGRADKLQFTLRGRGNTLNELARLSAFEARVIGGRLSVLGALQRPVADIRVSEAMIGALPGEPIRARLDGTLDETALDIRLSSGTLADLLRDTTHLPFSLAAQAAGARLTLEGEVALPLGRAGQLTFEMSGERLDSLNALARVELPAWGPWSLRGPLRMMSSGYELQGLLVRVGENRLKGNGTLEMSGSRPRLDVRVSAPSIQLDDFPLPDRLADAPPRAITVEALRQSASKAAGQTERLLGAGFLRRLDAYLDVEVQEVLSGSDRLADGSLRVQVVDGRVYFGPAVVNIPGGTLRLSAEYDPTLSEVELAAGAYVERFDYGIIARRLGRADDVKGLVSLNLELAGRAPSLDTIMHHAEGRVDFAVWPTELRSGIFSLWSVNLILSLVPLIDPGGDARLNCVVGRFDLKDGKLSDDKIIIDTTRVRVRGAGSINLASEQLAFVFRPRAKGFAPLRLQTPLRVSGTLTDFHIGIERRDLVESVLRMIASPILLPIEWFTLGPLPRDGADVCTNPLGRMNDRGR
ncbi:AsmA family protein [Propionivibrio sp.]|uniref:AsmA family protein n=1 Tax=Propionivibrio sp. TaxID=2212460 RepID=UPI003BF2114A